MRVLLSTYGSRGDVEPMAALAVALEALGAEALVSAPGDQEFVELMNRAGVTLSPVMPVREWIEWGKKSGLGIPGFAKRMIGEQYAAIGAAAIGCDAIVATGLLPSSAAAQCVAEKMGIRYEHVSLCPLYLPSHHHRPIPYPGHPLPPDVTDPRALWALNALTLNAIFGEAINTHRVSIGLPAVESIRDLVFTDHPLLASDPVLWPWLPTDFSNAAQTGAWILPDDRPLSAELIAFLDAGAPPIYVGFGSMSMQAAKDAADVAIEASRAQGRRVIVARGWADAGPADKRDDVFAVGDVNQQALFKRVAAVVHHGGAGTTTTAARAGAPQVVVPQIADQPYWAGRVAGLGIGVAHDGPAPTLDSLSAALSTALAPEMQAHAKAVADTMRSDGAATAAKLLIGATARSISTQFP